MKKQLTKLLFVLSLSVALCAALALNVSATAGSGAATFSPDEICTRAQIVTFLYRALEVA